MILQFNYLDTSVERQIKLNAEPRLSVSKNAQSSSLLDPVPKIYIYNMLSGGTNVWEITVALPPAQKPGRSWYCQAREITQNKAKQSKTKQNKAQIII